MTDKPDKPDEHSSADRTATGLSLPSAELQAPRRRIGRSWYGRVTIALGSLVFMLAIAFLGLFALLSRGPMAVPFLQERLAQALEQRMGGQIDVEVGKVVLQRADIGIELHVQNIVLKDAKGRELIRAPDSVVSFDNLRLAALDLAPRKLVLRNLAVHAEISPQGEVRFTPADATANPQTPGTEATRLEEAAALLAAMIIDGGKTGLQSLAINGGRLRLDDLRSGRSTVFDRFDIAFDADGSSQQGNSGAPFARISGEAARALNVTPFTFTMSKSGDGYKVGALLRNLDNALLDTIAGWRTPAFSTTARLALELDAELTADGRVSAAAGRLSTGAGTISFPGLPEADTRFDHIAASGKWTADSNAIQDVSVHFQGEGHDLLTTGTVKMPTDPQGLIRFDGTGKDWKLAALSKIDTPTVADAHFALTATRDLSAIRIESLEVMGPQTNLRLVGAMDAAGHVTLDLKGSRMPLRSVLRWWPNIFAPEVHNYFNQNVIDGQSTNLGISVDLSRAALLDAIAGKPLPEKSVLLDIAFENGALKIVDGMPPLSMLSGTGKLTMLQAQGVATKGQMDFRNGRRIPLSEGTFLIGRLNTPNPDAIFRFRAQAPLEAVIELLGQPALKGAIGQNAVPADAKGQFDGKVEVKLPLVKVLRPGDITTEVTATVTGATIDKAIGKDKLENATLSISTDKTGIDIKGNGTWQGQPVGIAVEQDSTDRSSSAVLTLNLDDAALKRRGINLGRQLTGALPVKIRTLQEAGGAVKAAVEIDLTRAGIDGLLPGFQKAVGRPARLTFDASERPTGYLLQNIVLESGPSSFRGQADVLNDGTVTNARFSLFRLSAGDNVRLDYDRQGNTAKVVVRGNNFDSRPFLKKMSEQGSSAPEADKDVEIDLKTTLLSGNGGEVLTNAELRLVTRQTQVRQMTLTGRLNGKSVQINGRGVGDAPAALTVQSDDAGGLLRFLDVYSRMVGGDVIGQLTPAGPRRLSGDLQFRNFSLRNEPAIRRLVAANARDGAASQSGDAVFTKMRLQFSRMGAETTVRDAVIFGNEIGLTFNGIVDPARDRVSLSGTFIPAYGLNNALAQIPVFGNLLAGGRNEGVLALTFGVSGRASAPNVTVNPLSAVAPGILRKIFEFRNETTGNTQSPISSAPN